MGKKPTFMSRSADDFALRGPLQLAAGVVLLSLPSLIGLVDGADQLPGALQLNSALAALAALAASPSSQPQPGKLA
jgi:hypothetical protein